MDADHSFYVKKIEAYVLQFFSLISDGLGSVGRVVADNIAHAKIRKSLLIW